MLEVVGYIGPSVNIMSMVNRIYHEIDWSKKSRGNGRKRELKSSSADVVAVNHCKLS